MDAKSEAKTKVTVADMAFLFAASALAEADKFFTQIKAEFGVKTRPGDQSDLEILFFVAFAHDLVIQQTGQKGFKQYGELISCRFREALGLYQEATGRVQSANVVLCTMEERFVGYFDAMRTNDPLVQLGGIAARRIAGSPDALVAAMAALRLVGILKFFGPLCGQYEVIEPVLAEIPRTAVVPTIQSLRIRLQK